MKMVIRADDVGYSKVCNIGTFEALEQGVATAADVMYDTPGTEDALLRLKDLPWISIGWHAHFWGSPVLDPVKVPSLYDKATGHFRQDIGTASDVNVDECVAEMHAQLDRGARILGRTPDTCMFAMGGSPFQDALAKTVEDYGMATNFAWQIPFHGLENAGQETTYVAPVNHADKKIYFSTMPGPGSNVFDCNMSDSLAKQWEYDPIRLWTHDEAHLSDLPADAVAVVILHPGYLDYYVCREGDRSPFSQRFLSIRAADAHAICSPELRGWIIENEVELMNFRDALYGTQEYQNHLRAIGSDLCML